MEHYKNIKQNATPVKGEDLTNKKYVDSKINDGVISSEKTWSSEKISKINVYDAKKVDSKPSYSAGTITYIKDGTSYTTTNDKQWFYYLDNGNLKQTIFIDGEELTIDGSSVDFDEYIKKNTAINTEPTSSGAISQFMVWEDSNGNNFGGMNFVTGDGIGRQFRMSDYEDHMTFIKSNGGTGVEERYKILDERDVPFKMGVNAKGEYGYYKEGESEITPFKSGADFESFAPTYEETETYNTKSLVLYNDNLYECLENGITGAFNVAKWKKVSISDISSNTTISNANFNSFTSGSSVGQKVTVKLGYKPQNICVYMYTSTFHWVYININSAIFSIRKSASTAVSHQEDKYIEITDEGFIITTPYTELINANGLVLSTK